MYFAGLLHKRMKLNLFCYSIFEGEVRVGGGRGDGVIGEGGMVKEGGGKGMRGGNGEGRVWGVGKGEFMYSLWLM